MDVTDPSYFGTLDFGAPETVNQQHPGDPEHTANVTCQRGEWRPPDRLAEYLPEDFSIPIDCYTGSNGLRRLVFNRSHEELMDLGVIGGLAVLHGINGFDRQVDHSYRSMQLINQHVRGRAYRDERGMKERIRRNFNHSRDLNIRQSGRIVDCERNVLPEQLGNNSAGEDVQFNVGQLTELGRSAATTAGYRNPISKVAIPFGFYEIAKGQPLELEPAEVPSLVKMSLFDLDTEAEPPTDDVLQIVTDRLLTAIDKHLDDSQEQFDNWFTGTGNTLVKQITRGKTKPGGDRSRKEVQGALLFLGWQSYQYVGQSLHALMRTIKNSMPVPLNDAERVIFERMHESQACYGGMPLALIAERAEFLRPAVLAIWNDPENEAHVHTLNRMLAYYGEMVTKRREADRRSKAKCSSKSSTSSRKCSAEPAAEDNADPNRKTCQPEKKHQSQSQSSPGTVQFVDNLHSPRRVGSDSFAKIAEHIRELRQIGCESRCEKWDYRRQGKSKTSVTIVAQCECGETHRQIKMSIEEFTRHAEEALQRKRVTNPKTDDP